MRRCGGDEGLEQGKTEVGDTEGADRVRDVGTQDGVGRKVFGRGGKG